MILETLFGIVGTALTGATGWALKQNIDLGNRVVKLETRGEDLPQLLDIKFDGVYQRLERIERGMNGFLHKG